jgi:hypothetical protein
LGAAALTGFVALAVTGGRLGAQVTPTGCNAGDCTIAMTKVGSLSDAGHPGVLPGPSPLAVRDRAGRYFMAAQGQRQVLVFDSAGRIASMIGAGEMFRLINAVLPGPNNTIYIYDVFHRQVTVIGADLKPVRQISASSQPALVRDDGSMVIAQQIRTPSLLGFPLHVMDGEGQVLRSFGADRPEYRPDLRLLTDRIVAPSHDRTVWAMPQGKYLIERWAPDTGKRLSSVQVASTWFVESTAFPSDGRTRPKPFIQALWEQDGLIWTLIRDADANWSPSDGKTERSWNVDLINSLHDWVIEVIQPESGKIIASQRYPTAYWVTPSVPLLTSHGPEKAGEPKVVNVWKPVLKRKEK